MVKKGVQSRFVIEINLLEMNIITQSFRSTIIIHILASDPNKSGRVFPGGYLFFRNSNYLDFVKF